jgi:hypothetical protein
MQIEPIDTMAARVAPDESTLTRFERTETAMDALKALSRAAPAVTPDELDIGIVERAGARRLASGWSQALRLTGPFCYGVLAGLIVALAVDAPFGLVVSLSAGVGAAMGLLVAVLQAVGSADDGLAALGTELDGEPIDIRVRSQDADLLASATSVCASHGGTVQPRRHPSCT